MARSGPQYLIGGTRKVYGRASWQAMQAKHRIKHPYCQVEGCKNRADVVHHKDKSPYRGHGLNLKSMCHACHNKLHHSKGKKKAGKIRRAALAAKVFLTRT